MPMLRHLAPLLLAIGTAAHGQPQPPPPDPASMARADLEAEVKKLRGLALAGAVARQRPTGCTTVDQRGFDFWLGEWDVSATGSTDLVAESSITLHDQGCAIVESWRPFQGASGHSINGYDVVAKQWSQTWIDATGRVTHYAGPVHDGTLAMDVIDSAPAFGGKFTRNRMNFRPVDANTVRQWGEGYDPSKQAWVTSWDLTYRRRAGARP